MALAAAVLLAALAGLLLAAWMGERGRRQSAEMDAAEVARARAGLERDLESVRGASRSDRDDLLRRLAEARGLLASEREAAGKARTSAAREAEALRGRADAAEARAGEAEKEAEGLREALARARRESSAAADALAAAETALAERERALAAAVAGAARPRTQGPPAAAPASEAPAIAFRSSAAGLELEMRGPRREVIPELFRIAASDDPDRARLARSALEGLLGESEGNSPAAAPGRTGILGWWDRSFGEFAEDTGLSGGAREGGDASSAAARRLRELREAWEREIGRETTPRSDR